MIKNITLLLGIALLITACSPKPFEEAKKIQEVKLQQVIEKMDTNTAPDLRDSMGRLLKTSFIPTVNFSSRKPNFVIIHHTAQDSLAQTIKTFTLERTQVSAHYVVSRDGEVVQMLNDELRAWHAGASKWGNVTDMNSCSIGIELDNNGTEPFTDNQINSLIILLTKLKTTYSIPASNFIGHADIAPKRKPDPSILFPWQKLAEKGFGLWYDIPNLMPPANFDVESALKRIGYETANLNSAIIAFKRHFVKQDLNPVMSGWDKCVLYNLYKKY
jgi:N-acetylmuramoyl-L-alanine amidase